MTTDQTRLRELMARPVRPARVDELRRDGNLFFVGGELPARDTLETVFDSHCQVPAELFHITFGGADRFSRGEELARQLKKNFNTHIMARLDYPAGGSVLERAYAAGVDIIDLPLHRVDGRDRRLAALAAARTIFPRWAVTSTLQAGEDAPGILCRDIDELLAAGVVPLVELAPGADRYDAAALTHLYDHLAAGWKRARVVLLPLQPLIGCLTPLTAARKGGILKGFIDRVHDRRLLASSDLRRSLRVRQVEESFESAAL